MHDPTPSTPMVLRHTVSVTLATLLVATAATAQAQAPGWGVLVAVGPDSEVQRAWQSRMEREQPVGADSVVGSRSVGEALGLRTQAIAREDLASLALVEAHLVQARVHTARLAEADALAELAAADRLLQSLFHVPGSSAFHVEVQTAIGLVAAQAQLTAAAEAAQRRAAVVDPSRGVRAAEAAPTWVERANQISREIATAPVGEIEVTTSPAGARVYLDDTLVGMAPTTLRATRGVHVLRLEADGYRALGALLPVDAGARPAVHVALARDPVVAALSELTDAGQRADQSRIQRGLRSLQTLGAPIGSVWLLRTHEPRPDRALVTRCTIDLCEPTRRFEVDGTDVGTGSYGQALDPAGFGRDRHVRDLAWLTDVAPSPARGTHAQASPAWWQRWYVWSAAAALVGGSVALGVAANQGPDPQRLRVTIEP